MNNIKPQSNFTKCDIELHKCGLCNEFDSKENVIKEFKHCFVMFNKYPYLPGHVMIVSKRPIVSLADCTKEERIEIIDVLSCSQQLVMNSLDIKSSNIGINTGTDSGGSILDHLHIHIVPRTARDMNFMYTTANTINKYPKYVIDAKQKIRDIFKKYP